MIQSDIHFIEDCTGMSLNCLFLAVYSQCGSVCREGRTGGFIDLQCVAS